MDVMSPEEYRAFLSAGTRTGKLATVRADGRPHVVPVWFVLDGADLLFMTGENTVKANNIRRRPDVCLCVDEATPPYHFVMVNGTAEILDPTPAELLKWSTAIGGRYMGPDHAEEFGRRNAVPGELLIRIRPDKVIAHKNMAD
jgi:PPOX class probable F420-dependent enzyme